MIYLTANDAPSGVYKSQVIDVVQFLRTIDPEPVRLVALVSLRNYFKQRREIREWDSRATVIPMFPRLKNWEKSTLFLRLIKDIRSERIIARGPLACSLAMKLNAGVVYDGRGAVKAELTEYPGMIPDKNVVSSFIEAERKAVNKAVFRIAVSHALVNYWKREFNYDGDRHVVIPCLFSADEEAGSLNERVESHRASLGYTTDDIVLIYSGGIAGWQSFGLLRSMLSEWILKHGVKVLFLTQAHDDILKLQKDFPEHIQVKWVRTSEVQTYLSLGDYGILIRDQNVTNEVASPVKFAEYLGAGLKVLISPKLGDYSDMVAEHNLGFVVNKQVPELEKTDRTEKQRIQTFAHARFTKQQYADDYIRLFKESFSVNQDI